MIKPMLCSSAPTGSDGLPAFPPKPDEWLMERKIDGWRFIAEVICSEYGVTWTGGRNGQTYFSRALDPAAKMLTRLPVGTILDGEMIAVTSDGAELKSPAVSSFLANPMLGRLVFVPFDILSVGGTLTEDLPLQDRKQLLGSAARRIECEHVLVHLGSKLDWDVYQHWLDTGSEGCVVKRRDSVYRRGARSRDWLKLKPQLTCDAVIIGIEMGRGESNRGMPGAFKIAMLDTKAMTSVKIPDDHTVESVAEDPNSWIGRRIEIRHHGLMNSDKPRHPVMVRTREDIDG